MLAICSNQIELTILFKFLSFWKFLLFNDLSIYTWLDLKRFFALLFTYFCSSALYLIFQNEFSFFTAVALHGSIFLNGEFFTGETFFMHGTMYVQYMRRRERFNLMKLSKYHIFLKVTTLLLLHLTVYFCALN